MTAWWPKSQVGSDRAEVAADVPPTPAVLHRDDG